MARPDMEDLLIAINQSAKKAPDGGISGIARRAHKNVGAMITRLSVSDSTHMPTVEDLVMAMEASGDVAPIEVLCQMFGGSFRTRTEEQLESVLLAACRAASESADVTRAVDESLSNDGVIDARERRMIMREISDVKKALQVIENSLGVHE